MDWPALNYDPTYSADGSEIAFASNITGEYAIYRQRLADGQSWRVTFGKGSARYPGLPARRALTDRLPPGPARPPRSSRETAGGRTDRR